MHGHQGYRLGALIKFILLAWESRLFEQPLDAFRRRHVIKAHREIHKFTHVLEALPPFFSILTKRFFYAAPLRRETNSFRCRKRSDRMLELREHALEHFDFFPRRFRKSIMVSREHFLERDLSDTSRDRGRGAGNIQFASRVEGCAHVRKHIFHFFAFEKAGAEDAVRDAKRKERFFQGTRLEILSVEHRSEEH